MANCARRGNFIMFEKLQRSGKLGNFFVTAVTLITTNWVLVMSFIAAVFAYLNNFVKSIVANQDFKNSAQLFLIVVWTFIGLLWLSDRKKPKLMANFKDYQYGLTWEGFICGIDVKNDEKFFGINMQARNFLPNPLKYTVEDIDLRIGNRTIPRYESGKLTSIMPRGAGRQSGIGLFAKSDVESFFNKTVEGTVEVSVVYGHPDLPPTRRFTVLCSINLAIWEKGNNDYDVQCSFGIDKETDEPIH